MDEGMEMLAPLVDHLHRFCRGHLESDEGAAARQLLSYLRGQRLDLDLALPSDRPHELGADTLALIIVRDVGELAGFLLDSEEPGRALEWSRSNLIIDIEAYRSAVGAG